ncbi:unnamed protein product, partial [Rhizoctonia solani]
MSDRNARAGVCSVIIYPVLLVVRNKDGITTRSIYSRQIVCILSGHSVKFVISTLVAFSPWDISMRDVSKYVGVDKPEPVFIPTTCSKFLRPRGRGYVDGSRGPYCLREELEAGKAIRELMKGTEGWEEKARENLRIINEEATQLKVFIRTLSVSDISWKENMIKAKRESVRNKLRVLGWEQQELELSDDLKRQWDRIVDVPTPLTERNWAYLELKLVSLITVSRSQ